MFLLKIKKIYLHSHPFLNNQIKIKKNIMLNETNSTELSSLDIWETLMIQIGSTWYLDNLYLYLITITGFLGVILNIVNMAILFKIEENQPIYKYFKVLTLNGILICFIFMFSFYTRTPRIFGFSLSFGAGIYRCKISTFTFTMSMFGSLLNICILFERISNFKPRLEKYFKFRTYWMMLIALAISVLINFPSYFLYEVRHESEFKEALKDAQIVQSFPYCERADFSDTLIGKIMIGILAFIKDFVFSFIEIVLTIISLIHLKKFFKTKQKVLKVAKKTFSNLHLNPIDQASSSSGRKKDSDLIKIRQVQQNQHLQYVKSQILSAKRSNRKLQMMSICFASFSILSNMTSLTATIIFVLISNGILFHVFSFIIVFTAILKYFVSFFLFYFFNKNFRKYFLKIFKQMYD